MVQSFFSCRSLQGIDLQEPSHEINKSCVRAVVHALLQSSLLGDQDVDLKVLVTLLRLLGTIALALRIIVIFAFFSLLVYKALTREEVRNKASFFHHMLRHGTDDSNHSG
jgi:hypothetical protein